MDHLIVMDDFSGIADDGKKFAVFLTVCRKYRYHCIYVSHIIAPESQIFLTFFHLVCHTIPLLKFFKIILDKQQKDMGLLLQCGLIGFLLTPPTQINDIVSQLTVVA